MRKVLFVCVQNAGRSQMAMAFFRRYAPEGMEALSAGTRPARSVDPVVVEAMREVELDVSSQRPRMLTPEMLEAADRVITMGCGAEASCPAAFVPTEDWELEDPHGRPIERVREIRDQIEARVKRLIEDIQREEDNR